VSNFVSILRVQFLSKLFLIAIICALGGCNPIFKAKDLDPRIGDNGPNAQAVLSPGTWDFSTAGDYTYDTNYISVTAGKATLLTVDQSFSSADDFAVGTHVGTEFSSGLTLKLPNSTELDASWTPAFGSIVSYFKLNGDLGTIADASTILAAIGSSGLSEDGSDSSMSYVNSKVGEGIFFDGVDDYLILDSNAASIPNGATNFSISAWVKWSSVPTGSEVVVAYGGNDADNGFFLIGSNTDLGIYLFDGIGGYYGSATAGSPPVANKWYHLAAIYDHVNLVFYVDGSQVASTPLTDNVISAVTFRVGNEAGRVNNLEGLIDEVAVWSEPLTGVQVQTIYDRQSVRFANETDLHSDWTPKWANVVGYWKMDNNWKDETVGATDGSAAGGATFSTTSKIGSHSGMFDGVNDYVVTNHDFDASGDFSISFWAKNGGQFDLAGSCCRPMITVHEDGTGLWGNSYDTISVYAYRPGLGGGNIGWQIGHLNHGVIDVGFDDGNWHFFSVTRSGAVIKFFYDGIEIASGAPGNLSIGNQTFFGAAPLDDGTGARYFKGNIDEMAIWNDNLTDAEVVEIYQRQKTKFTGSYTSPILNLGTPGVWTTLNWVTSLPFGKELPGSSGSELSSDYTSLVDSNGVSGDSDLSDGQIALWHMNEASWSGGANEVVDSSGSSNHGVRTGVANTSSVGILNRSADLTNGGAINITGMTSTSQNYTFSFWINPNMGTSGGYLFDASLNRIIPGYQFSGANQLSFHDAASATWRDFPTSLNDGIWYHVVYVCNATAGTVEVYKNGLSLGTQSYTGVNIGGTVALGSRFDFTTSRFNGLIDEVAIWERVLHANEVLQLYRRGANRVKYQVRSCDDAACSGETWIGPDGSAATYFRELHNCSSINGATGECNGSVNVASPSLTFSDFVTAPSANQYFQYRAILESDDEVGVCAGSTTCMPSVSSIEIGPTGRYFAGSPTIVNNTPVSFSSLSAFTETAGGTCTPTYQVSNDGATFYYWNGANWVVGVSAAQSSSAAAVNTNLSSFVTDVAAGSLYWRAYLNSDGSQTCELDQLEFSYE
jgi:hypothetical protein